MLNGGQEKRIRWAGFYRLTGDTTPGIGKNAGGGVPALVALLPS
jgi:hypothetical protein